MITYAVAVVVMLAAGIGSGYAQDTGLKILGYGLFGVFLVATLVAGSVPVGTLLRLFT